MTNVGDDDEEVRLVINGEEITGIYQKYHIHIDVFRQPGSFNLTLGDGSSVKELLQRFKKGHKFELWMGPTQIMTGFIDGRRAHGTPSVVTFTGRDACMVFTDNSVKAKRAFQNETYFELTQKVMEEVNSEAELLASNEKARQKFSGVNAKESKPPRLATEYEVIPSLLVSTQVLFDTTAASATARTITLEQGRTVRHIVSADVGKEWWTFLQEQYKKIGLFLWATAEGDFVISEPNPNQEASYRLLRRRGENRNSVNVIDADYEDGEAGAHAIFICYGKTGRGKNGRLTCRGEVRDESLIALGYDTVDVFEDDRVTSNKEAEFAARRRMAEERRRNFRLTYTVAGHRVLASQGRARAIWCPDTVVDVEDDEYGINDSFYLHGVSFDRDRKTTTKLHLCRKEDMVFAEEES